MKKILVDGFGGLTRIAALEDGRLTDLCVSSKIGGASVGDIYIVRIEKVLPNGLAFASIGNEGFGFIQPTDKREASAKLKNGLIAAVQVVKEAYDNKRAVLSTHISLKGEKGFAVLIMGESSAGVSSKIEDEGERARLKAIAEKYSAGFGVILRTASRGRDEAEIEEELDSLAELANKIRQAERFAKPPYKFSFSDEVLEIVEEMRDEDTEIIVSSEKTAKSLKKFSPMIYIESIPLFSAFGIQSELKRLLQRKVWLKSGGYIVIDEAEALSVIDVNSGKALGKKAMEKVNEEAAAEIARQLRIRNLCGMIVIDFISAGNINETVKLMRSLVKKDSCAVRVLEATELGLVQLTRQKHRRPLRSSIMRSCPHCDGSGFIKNADYIALSIANEVGAIFAQTAFNAAQVSAAGQVIDALEKIKDEIENTFGKKLMLTKIPVGRFDHYEIRKLN